MAEGAAVMLAPDWARSGHNTAQEAEERRVYAQPLTIPVPVAVLAPRAAMVATGVAVPVWGSEVVQEHVMKLAELVVFLAGAVLALQLLAVMAPMGLSI